MQARQRSPGLSKCRVDQGVAEEAYDDISGVLLDDMIMAESGLNKYLEMIYGRGETSKTLTVNEIVDYSFLKALT